MKVVCLHCGTKLKAPDEYKGKTIICPKCKQHFKVPLETVSGIADNFLSQKETKEVTKVQQQPQTPIQPIQTPLAPSSQFMPQTEVKTNVKQGALIGGCVCFALGIIFMFISLWTIIIYTPLFFAAFVLSIAAMAQRKILGGVLLLIGTVIIPPTLFFAIPAFKKVRAIATQIETQTTSLPAQQTPSSAAAIDTNYTPSPTQQTSRTEPPKPTIPELHFGDSVVIDDIKITIQGARIGYIEKRSLFGDSVRKSDTQYLLVDLTLENMSIGKIIYLQNIWEKTKLIDEFDNIEGTKFSDDIMTESITGFIGSAKIKPHEKLQDTIIFDLPVDAAKQFIIESDPGFWKSVGEDRVRQLSDSSFKIKFTRDQIK